MTLQTTKALPDLQLGHNRYDVGSVLNLARRGRYELDPAYQRGSVWGLLRRRNLIRSLLIGLPIGQITVNNRAASRFSGPGYDRRKSAPYAVIDGKQRIEALLAFSNGDFSVPRSWWIAGDVSDTIWEDTPDGPYVRFKHLTMQGEARFELAALPSDEARLSSVAEETEVFHLINFGGVPQGQHDPDLA
ncbi:DUF262 domain-containing protein [Streptomyces sp. NPDC101455]|uniref:DUF262 domain-containing protein n=1 Tax=Streptomyces sp. NPDC101455 TaxID=3366142 RepID=UPI0037F4F7CE